MDLDNKLLVDSTATNNFSMRVDSVAPNCLIQDFCQKLSWEKYSVD